VNACVYRCQQLAGLGRSPGEQVDDDEPAGPSAREMRALVLNGLWGKLIDPIAMGAE
jgi:hypothetical protein